MKKNLTIGILVLFGICLILFAGFVTGTKFGLFKGIGCTTIQSGELVGSDGSILTLGYNEWGYNYQAHMFNGLWCDYHPSYRPGGAGYDWCMENMADVELMMKWSDEWLSNKDCNEDGNLDRGYSCDPENAGNSACYGAWLTNHERGTYINDAEETCKYEYFVKIITPPEDAYTEDDVWYAADDTPIGPVIWGGFAIIQEFMNDPCEGGHDVIYKSPSPTGLGFYT